MNKHQHKIQNPKVKRVNRITVKVWMLRKRITARYIQRELGHRYPTQVSETINGVRNNRQVLAWLVDHGCPIDDVKLPPNMIDYTRSEVQS